MTIHGSNFAVPASMNTVTIDGTTLDDVQGSTSQTLIVGIPGNLSGVPGTKALVVSTTAGGASNPFNVHFVAPDIVLVGEVSGYEHQRRRREDRQRNPGAFPVPSRRDRPVDQRAVQDHGHIRQRDRRRTGICVDSATSFIGTSGADHQVTVGPVTPVNVGIQIVPPATAGASPPEVDLHFKAVSIHNDPGSSSLEQKIHIAVGAAPPAADPTMKITLGQNNRSTVHLNSAGDGLDIKYGATATITIDATMGHQGLYQFTGAIANPDSSIWQIVDLPTSIQFGNGQGQPVQFSLKLIPTTPPASSVTRTFTLTATRQDTDAIGHISSFLSFPISGFTP